jgi:hypothetical protein
LPTTPTTAHAGRGGGHGGADGVAEGDVADDAFAEEGGDAMEGAIDELVGDDEVSGLVLFLERADGGDGEDALDAELFEGVDVGAEVELGGQDAMAAAVAGKEGDFAAFELAEDEGVRGRAEGRFHGFLVDVGESRHGVEPAAADDADFRLRQCLLLRASSFQAISGPRVCFVAALPGAAALGGEAFPGLCLRSLLGYSRPPLIDQPDRLHEHIAVDGQAVGADLVHGVLRGVVVAVVGAVVEVDDVDRRHAALDKGQVIVLDLHLLLKK